MGQAVLPFIEYIILQLGIMVVGLNLIRDKEIGFSGVLKCWIFGQMLCFAVLQIIAVPMILTRWKFNVLFWSYVGIFGILFGFGCWRLRETKIKHYLTIKDWNWLSMLLLVAALALVLNQSGQYFFKMHLDEDDARWLAEANDALAYGDMLTRNPSTGGYMGAFAFAKDVTSPWPMMYAVWARILHTRPSVFAHTIYAPVELLLMYGIYWLIGSAMFRRTDAKAAFLLIIATVHMFFSQTVYTSWTFSLVRIWQGKATVAAVIIPLVYYVFIRIYQKDSAADWARLAVIGLAACLMSGVGVSVTAMMYLVLGGYGIIMSRNWKRAILLAACYAPVLFCTGIYFYLKG